ncbi:hypothetical protein D3C84_1227550 [compost metagenome]
MDTGNSDFSPFDHRLDGGQHVPGHIIVELHPAEAKPADFTDHFAAYSMALNIPAC